MRPLLLACTTLLLVPAHAATVVHGSTSGSPMRAGASSAMTTKTRLLKADDSAGNVAPAAPPTLDQLGSDDMAVRGSGAPCNVSDAVCNSELFRNLPAISNFVGSVGTAQQVVRTHTPFVISSVTVPPLMACGGAGCGSLRVDGEVPVLQTTQWRAYQAQRRAHPTASGVMVTSRLRLAFEQPAVLWELDFNASTPRPAVNISVSWGASVAIASQMGWTAALPEPVASSDAVTRGPVVAGLQTAMTARRAGGPVESEAGISLFALVGAAPPRWSFPQVDDYHQVEQQCNVSGRWRFDTWPASQEMTFVEPPCDNLKRHNNCSKGHFTFESANPQTPWRTATGTVAGSAVTIHYNCSGGESNVAGVIDSTCDTIDLGLNGRFTRGFHPSPPPAPPPGQAIANLSLDASGGGATLQAIAVFGRNLSQAIGLLERLASNPTTFASSWSEAHQQWEDRWQSAFSPGGSAEYSGSLPVLTVARKTEAVAPLERAYYMGVLTILLVQRNNLPILGGAHSWPAQPRIYMTGMGNADGNIAIGVSQRWFWDSAQHSLTSSLLDPAMYKAEAEQIIAYYQQFLAKLRDHQQLLVVPGTFACSTGIGTTQNSTSQDGMVLQKLDVLEAWAKRTPQVGGFYAWHLMDRMDMPDSERCDFRLGAVSMPTVMAKLREIGSTIVSRAAEQRRGRDRHDAFADNP